MTNVTIRRRIIFSFALVLSLMLGMLVLYLLYLADIDRARASMTRDSLPGLYVSDQLMVTALSSHASTLALVVISDPAARRRLEHARRESLQRSEQLLRDYQETIQRAEDRTNFAHVQRELTRYSREQEEVARLSLAGADGAEHERAASALQAQFERVQAPLEALAADNKLHADRSSAQIARAVGTAQVGLLIAKLTALVIALLCGFYLLRAVTRPLARLVTAVDVVRTGNFSQRLKVDRKDEFAALAEGFNRMGEELTVLIEQIRKSGAKVNTSVTEIASTSRQQQATASEIAATTSEIGATSREISATSRELSKTMTDVAHVAEQAASLAGRGQAGVGQMEATMQRVAEATGAINAKLAVLNEKAGNIGQVVTTITKVADQTNLLSLNAAIEAEKAGEYGRGFAVVATEIRRLADQTAVATYDIEQMVKEIQSAVSAGVMGMDRFAEEVRRGMQEIHQVGAQLTEIIQHVQALAPRCEAVNEGMQAQATGAEQITDALGQLSEAAQQTVESLRQSNMALSELDQVASTLRTGIARFQLDA